KSGGNLCGHGSGHAGTGPGSGGGHRRSALCRWGRGTRLGGASLCPRLALADGPGGTPPVSPPAPLPPAPTGPVGTGLFSPGTRTPSAASDRELITAQRHSYHFLGWVRLHLDLRPANRFPSIPVTFNRWIKRWNRPLAVVLPLLVFRCRKYED